MVCSPAMVGHAGRGAAQREVVRVRDVAVAAQPMPTPGNPDDPATKTERSPMDFPEEIGKALPSNRPDIFPELKPIKPVPDPPNLPGDPEIPDDEAEEDEENQPEQPPGEEEEGEEGEEGEEEEDNEQVPDS